MPCLTLADTSRAADASMRRWRVFAAGLALLPLAAWGASFDAARAGKNPDGAWTAAAERAVAASALPASPPGDIQAFCPAHADRSPEERVRFWAGLAVCQPR